MKSTFVMAQLQALPDPKDNLEKAEQAIKDAKAQYNPDFMVFPETVYVPISGRNGSEDHSFCIPAHQWSLCYGYEKVSQGIRGLDGLWHERNGA